MNLAVPLVRHAVSPYARRLARERNVTLDRLAGSGPGGRIVAADIPAAPGPVMATPESKSGSAPSSLTFACSAEVSLTEFFRLSREAAPAGLVLEIEDAALRAAAICLADLDEGLGAGIALETDGRQSLIAVSSGLSIGAERRKRLRARDSGADAAAESAVASLLVLESARVTPVSTHLLLGRALRLVLVVDRDRERGRVILSAASETVAEGWAISLLEAFVTALEGPLALMA